MVHCGSLKWDAPSMRVLVATGTQEGWARSSQASTSMVMGALAGGPESKDIGQSPKVGLQFGLVNFQNTVLRGESNGCCRLRGR